MLKIFLSHASSDSELALYIKTVLEKNLKEITVFCSSDPTDLPPGSKWPSKIQKELRTSDLFLLLATSRSLSRPWVWFECGTFWFKDKKLIPLCSGQVRKNKLVTPLSERMALNLDEPKDIDSLFQTIEQLADINREPIDIPRIVKTLSEKEKSGERTARMKAGWTGVNWNRRFLCYDGPIEGLELIEDRAFQRSMSEALASEGFKVYLSNPESLTDHAEKGYRIIYLTDRECWRQKIVKDRSILIARPNQLLDKDNLEQV